jgi:hypothetical protein
MTAPMPPYLTILICNNSKKLEDLEILRLVRGFGGEQGQVPR